MLGSSFHPLSEYIQYFQLFRSLNLFLSLAGQFAPAALRIQALSVPGVSVITQIVAPGDILRYLTLDWCLNTLFPALNMSVGLNTPRQSDKLLAVFRKIDDFPLSAMNELLCQDYENAFASLNRAVRS